MNDKNLRDELREKGTIVETALERENADLRAQVADLEVGNAELISSTANELCCESDNEAILAAASDLRAQLAAMTAERDEWIACHAKNFRELQEAKTLVGNKCQRITELEKEAEENARIIGMSGEREAKHLSMIEQRDRRIAELEAAPDVRDAYPQAHRLAMELECFMLSCTDTAVTAKWWDSANEALEQWREFNAAQGADALKGAPTEKGGAA